jgi:hypothetical protein
LRCILSSLEAAEQHSLDPFEDTEMSITTIVRRLGPIVNGLIAF